MRASEKNLRLFFPGCTRAVDVRAVMIDLDGTMVNTLGDFDLALNGMLAEQQWPRVECSFIERMIGKGSPHLVRQTLLHLGLGRDGAVDGALYERAHTCYQQHYNRINGRASHLYPGVKEGVEQLHAAGLRLACITNKPTEHAIALLHMLGIGQYFSFVHGGDRFERRKPDPMPLVARAARSFWCVMGTTMGSRSIVFLRWVTWNACRICAVPNEQLSVCFGGVACRW